jgi:hypothetical protein
MISTSESSTSPPAALRTRLVRWLRSPHFARDIVLVLAFKLVLLLALKYAFFNHPQAENMSMPPAEVAREILSIPVPNTPSGDQHAH